MKQSVFIPTRLTSRTRVLAGCVVLALSTAAFGQADRQSQTDRQSTDPSSIGANRHDTADHKTIEGRLVPLFHALNGHESATDPLMLNKQPSTTTSAGSTTRPGQPGATTRPGGAIQPDSATRPGGVAQPGSTTPGSPSRSQAGLPGESATTSAQPGLDASPSSMGAMPVAQPLALIADSGMSSTERSSGEGRPSTPPVGSTSPSTSQRSTTTPGSSSVSGDTDTTQTQGYGELYVLVFDPADPESRSAYLMAQAICRSAMTGSSGAIGTQGTRDSLGTPGAVGTTGTRDTPSSRTDSRTTPGAATSEIEREQDTQRDATSSAHSALGKSSGMGERVKITGRVIEREGVQAIAVQKVERQYEDSTASVSTIGGNR